MTTQKHDRRTLGVAVQTDAEGKIVMVEIGPEGKRTLLELGGLVLRDFATAEFKVTSFVMQGGRLLANCRDGVVRVEYLVPSTPWTAKLATRYREIWEKASVRCRDINPAFRSELVERWRATCFTGDNTVHGGMWDAAKDADWMEEVVSAYLFAELAKFGEIPLFDPSRDDRE